MALVSAVVGATGCEKTRALVHDLTKPTASAAASVAPPVVEAGAAPPVVPSAPPSASAAPDAGKPATTGAAKATPPAPKKAPPKLNGLPAGAVCAQGKEGNGGCASGSECTNGRCTCYNGWTSCDGACRDLSRDPYNCDKCGRECQYGQYCKWGHCE